MNLSASLILYSVLIIAAGPAMGSGLIPGLLECEPTRTPLFAHDNTILDSSSLAEPASMLIDSANITLEYNAENLIRTKTNGRLTADVTTSGRTESLFIPLHIAKNPTTFAICHAISNGSAYYEDVDMGADLTMTTNSFAWAVNHSVGATRIGIAGSQHSSLMPGRSTYPGDVFEIFSGWTPVRFSLDSEDALIQVAQPISRNSEVCVEAGIGSSSLHALLGQDNNRISIPAEAGITQYGIGINNRMNRKLNVSMGYLRSSGSGSNSIYHNERQSGTLQYEPRSNQLSASLSYRKSPTSVWEAGYVSSSRGTNLRGISLRGRDLGINLEPFSDRIDFNADLGLSVGLFHMGMQRQISDKWQLGWCYKYARTESDLNADYIGRAFFGLINVSGNYSNSLLSTGLHGLELSARYSRERTSVEIRVEQVIPAGSGGAGASSGHDTDEQAKTTGGTSVSLISSYAL